jgi:hypothetical protein
MHEPLCDEANAHPQKWVIVCVGCLRTQHNGRWTDHRVDALRGRHPGLCDECVVRVAQRPKDAIA